jgi:hypothetical protein
MILFHRHPRDLPRKDPVQITVTYDIQIPLYKGVELPFFRTKNGGEPCRPFTFTGRINDLDRTMAEERGDIVGYNKIS